MYYDQTRKNLQAASGTGRSLYSGDPDRDILVTTQRLVSSSSPTPGMTSYLGPESPRPFSVISEGYLNRLQIPEYTNSDKYSFGEAYESKMFQLIHKYLELDTYHRFCYVGEEKGSMAERIQDHFCLLDPIVEIVPGCIAREESPDQTTMVSIPIAGVGAEEYFSKKAREAPYGGPFFDRIILMDAVQYLDKPKDTYKNIMTTVDQYGKLLIIHRPGFMNSLPYSRETLSRVISNDQPYMEIIRDLQANNYDVQWEIETLPIIMPKVKWLSMMKHRYPTQLEAVSNFEVQSGLRELSEGVFKYEGHMVEFVDRLLFITVSHSISKTGYPTIQRFGVNGLKPLPGVNDMQYQMEITPDIARYVKPKPVKKPQTGQGPLC